MEINLNNISGWELTENGQNIAQTIVFREANYLSWKLLINENVHIILISLIFL